jgi:carboxylesterase type B
VNDVVITKSGAVRGQWRDGVLSALGIPYATAPRFSAPAPRAPWDGIRDGSRFGPAAPQLPPAPGVPPVWQPADGLDCLNLNVWTPSPGATGLPVMVWLHGGLWKHGACGSTAPPACPSTTRPGSRRAAWSW